MSPDAPHTKIFITRRLASSRQRLFHWLTRPEKIAQWFGPKQFRVSEVIMDVRAGGQYQIWLEGPGKGFSIIGEFLDVFEPERLEFSFRYEGVAHAPPSVVKIVLHALAPHETELILTQDFEWQPDNMPQRSQAWVQMFSRLEVGLRA